MRREFGERPKKEKAPQRFTGAEGLGLRASLEEECGARGGTCRGAGEAAVDAGLHTVPISSNVLSQTKPARGRLTLPAPSRAGCC